MAKNLLPWLLFYTFFPICTSLFASEEPSGKSNNSPLQILCDAPAPDSFRVTNGGSSFVTLSWSPAWAGANHTLKVLRKNEIFNTWDLVNTFPNVSGSSFTVTELQYKAEHRFIIATKCTSGEASDLTSSIDHINLILDLTLAGRTPLGPTPVSGACPTIKYKSYPWVGFKIATSNNFSPPSTFYEFVASYDGSGNLYPVIKRVEEFGPIMGLGNPSWSPGFVFPKNPFPKVVPIEGSTTFLVRHYISASNFIPVGNVTVDLIEGAPNTIRFCPNNWNQGYELIPLTAQFANGFSPTGDNLFVKKDLEFENKVKAQSPFNDFLQIFLTPALTREESILFSLVSLDGQTVFQQKVEALSETLLVPTNFLSEGFYLLRVQTKHELQTIKIVKSN